MKLHLDCQISLFCCRLAAKLCLILQPHELQHARLPCPSLSPGVCSDSYPLSQWCPPNVSSSAAPLSSCPRSFPASGSFPMSQLLTSSGCQSVRTSASVLPMNIQGWFPSGLIALIFLTSKGLSRVFTSTTVQKNQFFGAQPSYGPTLTSIQDYWKN